MSDKTIQDLITKSEADTSDGASRAAFYKNIFIPSLARDIVLFGKQHGVEIIEQYGLDASDLAKIIEMPIFKSEVKNLRMMMDEGVLITAQMKAAAALEGAVDVLAAQLIREDIKPNEVCMVVRELKQMATLTHTQVISKGAVAKGDEVTSAAGMVVNFSFGDPSQLPPVREAIDVTPVSKLIQKEETVVDVNMFNEVANESER
nr:MAG TPA: hypothetical protein [Caudoviricetes sp.]